MSLQTWDETAPNHDAVVRILNHFERARNVGRACGEIARFTRSEPDGIRHWEEWIDRKEIQRTAGKQIYAIAREQFLTAFRDGYATDHGNF